MAACRELTKLHEEVLVGSPEVQAALREQRGELTLVISGIPAPDGDAEGLDAPALVAAARRAGLAPRTIVELLRAAGIPRREAYRVVSVSALVIKD